jgi:hypothetical protein
MPPRPCLVTVTDGRGIRHAVEVQANSLYEAAALGLQALKSAEWVEEIGSAISLEVEIHEPVVRHTVTVTEEHERLEDQMRLLQQEHAALHDRPDDLPAHREHRTRLRQHIVELRAHIRQLRRERNDTL